MSGPTAGPWISRTDTVESADGLTICDVRHAGTWSTDANANLIAASPDLLEACRFGAIALAAHVSPQNNVPECHHCRDALAKMRTAIKKAEGVA